MVTVSVICGANANGNGQYDRDSNTKPNTAVQDISPVNLTQITGSQPEANSTDLQILGEHTTTIEEWVREYQSNWSTDRPFVIPAALPGVCRPGLAALEIDTKAKVPENSIDDPYSFTLDGTYPLRLAFGGIPLRCASAVGEVDWVTELNQLKQAAASATAAAHKKADKPRLRRSNAHFKGNPRAKSGPSSNFKADDHNFLQRLDPVDQAMRAVHSPVPRAAIPHSSSVENDLSEEDILEEKALHSCLYTEALGCILLDRVGERVLHGKPPGLKNWSPLIPANATEHVLASSLDYNISTYSGLPSTLPPFTPRHIRPSIGRRNANTDFRTNLNGPLNIISPSVDMRGTHFTPSIPAIQAPLHSIPSLDLDEITIAMVRNLTTPDVLTPIFRNREPLRGYYAPGQFGVDGDTQWPQENRDEEHGDNGSSTKNKDNALGSSGAGSINDDWNYDGPTDENSEKDNTIMESIEATIIRRRRKIHLAAIRAAGTRRILSSEIEHMSCNFLDYCNQDEGELFWRMLADVDRTAREKYATILKRLGERAKCLDNALKNLNGGW